MKRLGARHHRHHRYAGCGGDRDDGADGVGDIVVDRALVYADGYR